MQNRKEKQPDYLFEIGWEVCNKVGGIYTVLSSKAAQLVSKYQDNYILIGPDVWKGTCVHPEFEEDQNLFKIWRQEMEKIGLKAKIGRWRIDGNPVVVLIDFTPFFAERNDIFKHFWIKFKLDSLYGQWDYIEPALFGFAAGKVIESFYWSHINSTDYVIAHFHEWMTGTGLLYLKENTPQIATVFTTHATVTGRAIAGKGLPFYQDLNNYNPEQQAKDTNVLAKHSLEKLTAENADSFTTVSWVTANECAKMLGKNPDVVTPNGFNYNSIPNTLELEKKRTDARKKIIQVAEGLFNLTFPNDSFLIIKSGRYEYRNKGIDVFLESLKELNNKYENGKKVIALIFVPGNQTGPRKELIDRIKHPDFDNPLPNELITHNLQGAQKDPIVNHINHIKLNQNIDDHVKVIFIPTYLDGNDGIFDLKYYDLLAGFDLAVFPSYYEPWGYTPLESLAYHIPSVTTDVSGFGRAIIEMGLKNSNGISILERKESSDEFLAKEVADTIKFFLKQSDSEINASRLNAHQISQYFSWENQIKFYWEAFNIALDKSLLREESYCDKPQVLPVEDIENIASNPQWRALTVKTVLPDSLYDLKELSGNLWWSWNESAKSLFNTMDSALWIECHQNPVKFLQTLDYRTIHEYSIDRTFQDKLQDLVSQYRKYIQEEIPNQGQIAYFCMEYGLHNTLKLYSGGLGILAGDFLKESSDSSIPIVAIGLLYKTGYFKQRLSASGDQLVEEDLMNFSELPIQLMLDENNQPLRIVLPFPGRAVHAQIWKLEVGRISLYLLDSYVDQNKEEDKWITRQLYSGNKEHRLKQELILGMGGIQALKLLGIEPEVFHYNEGHAAFVGISRIQDLISNENLSFNEALEVVRSTSLFTTHTSVTAGIDKFSEELLRTYFSHIVKQFNISWERFMNLGRIAENDPDILFSMANLSLRISQEANAVSKIHQQVSNNLFGKVWKDFFPEEMPIGYITNGVHYDTWTAGRWKTLHKKYLGEDYLKDTSNWQKIDSIPETEIWSTKLLLKKELLASVKERMTESMTARHESPSTIRHTVDFLQENALIIGYARRIVSYKRPYLFFADINRLSAILNNKERPVLIFFSGKSHPQDAESIKLIKKVIQSSFSKELQQKIFFLEDYDINLGSLLIQGVDLWLNTPERQKEASGTSGMKALLNGTLNFSVLDGWWAEAYDKEIGWGLEAKKDYDNQEYQNDLDSDKIYKILENEIIPLYFDRNDQNISEKWVAMMRMSMRKAPQYLMSRVMKEYYSTYYSKLIDRGRKIKANGFAIAKELAVWKKYIRKNWSEINVTAITPLTNLNGYPEEIKVELSLGAINPTELCVEMVAIQKDIKNGEQLVQIFELSAQESDKGKGVFVGKINDLLPGNYQYSFRIYPKNKLLPNRFDFPLVKWV